MAFSFTFLSLIRTFASRITTLSEKMSKKLRQGSLCVHAGYKAKNGEPIELPIIQSTTFKYDDSDEMAKLFDLEKEGYFYTRLQNPTNDAPTSMPSSISVRQATTSSPPTRFMAVRIISSV